MCWREHREHQLVERIGGARWVERAEPLREPVGDRADAPARGDRAEAGRRAHSVAARGVAELRERGLEVQHDLAGRPVPVLGDDQLRVALALLVTVVAVDEHHDVGVLLDRARFAQVRELRPLVGARLGVAVELRESDDRDLELLREQLERPGDLGDLLLTVVGAAGAGRAVISCR